MNKFKRVIIKSAPIKTLLILFLLTPQLTFAVGTIYFETPEAAEARCQLDKESFPGDKEVICREDTMNIDNQCDVGQLGMTYYELSTLDSDNNSGKLKTEYQIVCTACYPYTVNPDTGQCDQVTEMF